MKKFLLAGLLIAALICGGTLAGCKTVIIDVEEGPVTTRTYDFTDFTGIEVGHAFELEVAPSDNYSITITGREGILDRVDVTKSGSTLKIDTDTWFLTWHSTPKVTITMPSLQRLNLSGAARGDARGFKSSSDFEVELTGASHLDMDMGAGAFRAQISGASSLSGELETTSSDIALSGASNITLTGFGGDLAIDASGASRAKLAGYPVNDAGVELSGASSAELTVSGRMDVDLSGASKLEYYGDATLGTIDISGASDLEHKTAP
jgi:hypothetical protein